MSVNMYSLSFSHIDKELQRNVIVRPKSLSLGSGPTYCSRVN